MTPFEYLSVLVSIVLALGIAHLLTGLSSILRSEGKTRLCWIQLAWSLVILGFQIAVWWRYWAFNGVEEWRLIQFVSLLFLPAMTYLAARIIMPDVIRDDTYDLKAHFDQVRQEFFWTLFVALLLSLLVRPLFFGEAFWAVERLPAVLVAALAPAGAVISDRRFQGALVISVAAIWLGAVLFLWNDLTQAI